MKKIAMACMMMLTAFVAQSQESNIELGGTRFKFSNGVMEWSDAITYNLQSQAMEEKGIAAVPLQFRIKVKKKKMMACHFYVEIKNLSDKTGIKFAYYNSYTDASGKRILHSVKLSPGATAEGDIIYSSLSCKVKEENDCINCSWGFSFDDIKVLK